MKTTKITMSVAAVLVGIFASTFANAANNLISRSALVKYNGGHEIRVVYAKGGFNTDSHKLSAPYAPWAQKFRTAVAYALDGMNPSDLRDVKSVLIVGDIKDLNNNKVAGFSCSKCASSVLVLSMNNFVNTKPASIKSAVQREIFAATKLKAKIVSHRSGSLAGSRNLCEVIDEASFADNSGTDATVPGAQAGATPDQAAPTSAPAAGADPFATAANPADASGSPAPSSTPDQPVVSAPASDPSVPATPVDGKDKKDGKDKPVAPTGD